ncbi:hypothetical protein BH93_26975 (plasmid) [Rhodococcoides fascians A25f]|uniref:hypothetical protein n=1 Tax=Rhodococcoides fascians TaxID=1828 RepID=UPI0005657085|nr:hypothetical protein [Rhodococcus fascians]QII09223.1 hypothetical protein BH93_26975 [Rhodococcus fascians A25f]
MGRDEGPEVGKDVGKVLISTVVLSPLVTILREQWGLWAVVPACVLAVLFLVWQSVKSDYLALVRRWALACVGVAYVVALAAIAVWPLAPTAAKVGLPAAVWVLAAVVFVRVIAPDSRFDSVATIGAIAIGGFGLAMVGTGVSTLVNGSAAQGLAIMSCGVSAIAIGGSLLWGLSTLAGSAGIGYGLSIIGLGVALLWDGSRLTGGAVVGGGIAIIGVGLSIIYSDILFPRFVRLGAGGVMVILGVPFLSSESVPLHIVGSIMVVAGGVAAISTFLGGLPMFKFSVLIGSAAVVGTGVLLFSDGEEMLGIAESVSGAFVFLVTGVQLFMHVRRNWKPIRPTESKVGESGQLTLFDLPNVKDSRKPETD